MFTGLFDPRVGSGRVKIFVNHGGSGRKFYKFIVLSALLKLTCIFSNTTFLFVFFCFSLCTLLVHVMFTSLYMYEYKFNNMELGCSCVLKIQLLVSS